MANIFTRNLTRSQDRAILLVGIIFWAMGGILAWATEGIEHESYAVRRPSPAPHGTPAIRPALMATLSPAMSRQWQKLAARRISARMKRTHHLDQHL